MLTLLIALLFGIQQIHDDCVVVVVVVERCIDEIVCFVSRLNCRIVGSWYILYNGCNGILMGVTLSLSVSLSCSNYRLLYFATIVSSCKQF